MKNISRRKFLQVSALAGGATLLPMPLKWLGRSNAYAFYQSTSLKLWQTTLRGVGPGQIPVAAPDGKRYWQGGAVSAIPPASGSYVAADHYTINIEQFTDQVYPAQTLPTGSVFGPTTFWGFNPVTPLGGGVQPPKHLGGIIVAERGRPLQITFKNNLLNITRHIIPNDVTIPGANQQVNRTAVHLHGGFIPWISDGGPFDWWDPAGNHGLSFLNNQVLNPAALPGEADYYYTNYQSARLVWYHDHAWGITRINAYAGIASAYVIRDDFERAMFPKGLPPFIETSVLGGTVVRELPIVIQDKIFVDAANILALDPTWPGPLTTGSLWYPHVYERNRWKLGGNAQKKTPDPSVIPEMFGDTMLVNGTVFPQVPVEPRIYRLRILNACNARFLNLQLFVDDGTPNGITLNAATGIPTNLTGPSWHVIGQEGGFLPNPVTVPPNVAFNPVTLTGSLVTGNAERWDVLVDFSAFAGKNIILYTDAPAPFPIGDPRNDYFPGWNVKQNPVNALTLPGSGPNTRVMMRFNVGNAVTAPADLPVTITGADLTAGLDPFLVPPATVLTPPAVGALVSPAMAFATATYPNAVRRSLTLNETFDIYGRLQQLLGTNVPLVAGTFGRTYLDTPTETPNANAPGGGNIEIWEIANLTGDTHPIHFHLVNVQILDRQLFSVNNYNGVPKFLAPPTPPQPYEVGWKETVRMNPGEVTRVIMRFDLPQTPFVVPPSPRTGGNEYVWHCHILEHEEHDMMRPLVVAGAATAMSNVVVTPASQSIPGLGGGTATFAISGGVAPYKIAASVGAIAPTNVTATSFDVVVPPASALAVMSYTITDSLGMATVAVLNIV